MPSLSCWQRRRDSIPLSLLLCFLVPQRLAPGIRISLLQHQPVSGPGAPALCVQLGSIPEAVTSSLSLFPLLQEMCGRSALELWKVGHLFPPRSNVFEVTNELSKLSPTLFSLCPAFDTVSPSPAPPCRLSHSPFLNQLSDLPSVFSNAFSSVGCPKLVPPLLFSLGTFCLGNESEIRKASFIPRDTAMSTLLKT